jgi:hypothetical protein
MLLVSIAASLLEKRDEQRKRKMKSEAYSCARGRTELAPIP